MTFGSHDFLPKKKSADSAAKTQPHIIPFSYLLIPLYFPEASTDLTPSTLPLQIHYKWNLDESCGNESYLCKSSVLDRSKSSDMDIVCSTKFDLDAAASRCPRGSCMSPTRYHLSAFHIAETLVCKRTSQHHYGAGHVCHAHLRVFASCTSCG